MLAKDIRSSLVIHARKNIQKNLSKGCGNLSLHVKMLRGEVIPFLVHSSVPEVNFAGEDGAHDDDEAAASPDPAALLHTFGLLTSSCVEVNVVKICDP